MDIAEEKIKKVFTNAVRDKIYGSIEIFFEEGNVTQITQRIINKLKPVSKPKTGSKFSHKPNTTIKVKKEIIDQDSSVSDLPL